MNNQDMLEEAKRRASSLVSFLDLVGEAVDQPAAIRAAALGPLSHRAVQAVSNLAFMALANVDGVAAILAGRCCAEALELLADLQVPQTTPNMSSKAGRASRRG